MRVHFELTDTLGGEANYSWVKRDTFTLPDTTTTQVIVKLAREWAGYKHSKYELAGDTIVIRPRGLLQVLFISFDHSSDGADVAGAMRVVLAHAKNFGEAAVQMVIDDVLGFARRAQALGAEAPTPAVRLRQALQSLLAAPPDSPEWQGAARAAEAALALPPDVLQLADVVAWADGIMAAQGTPDLANRVSEQEAVLATAILKAVRPNL